MFNSKTLSLLLLSCISINANKLTQSEQANAHEFENLSCISDQTILDAVASGTEEQIDSASAHEFENLSRISDQTLSILRNAAHNVYGLFFPEVTPITHPHQSVKEIIYGTSLLKQERVEIGHVEYIQATNQLIISFAGTSNPDQAATDALANMAQATNLRGNVHYGFNRYTHNMLESLIAGVEKVLIDHSITQTEIFFTGHSLGGATAMLAASNFKHLHPELASNQIKVVTFSAPLVGDAHLNAHMHELLGKENIINFACTADTVTFAQLPGNTYEPFGHQISYDVISKCIADSTSTNPVAEQALEMLKQISPTVYSWSKWGYQTVYPIMQRAYPMAQQFFKGNFTPTASDLANALQSGAVAAHSIPTQQFIQSLFKKYVQSMHA